RGQAERSMVTEARYHPAYALLRSIPQLGPVRVARLISIIDTPHRVPNKAAFWNYCCPLESRSRTQQRHKRWRSQRTADYPTAPGAPYPRYRVSDIQDSEVWKLSQSQPIGVFARWMQQSDLIATALSTPVERA